MASRKCRNQPVKSWQAPRHLLHVFLSVKKTDTEIDPVFKTESA